MGTLKTKIFVAVWALLTFSSCCADEAPDTYKGAALTACFSVGDDYCCTYEGDDNCSETVCEDTCWETVESWVCW